MQLKAAAPVAEGLVCMMPYIMQLAPHKTGAPTLSLSAASCTANPHKSNTFVISAKNVEIC